MKILDVLTSPWAIVPEKLLEIQNIYATHLRGDKIDLKAVEAQLGKPLVNEPKAYEHRNGVGIVRVEGVLARRANLFMRISGGTSTEQMRAQFREALADRDAASILLVIDSPGGTVDGTQEFAEEIYRARGSKPIKAVALGTIASAAYWIGAAADELYLASDTTVAGSIGVVATHVDVSRAEERMGFKTTEITAGKYKRIASQYGPLTQEGRASMQDMVDDIYTAFVQDVAAFRKKSVDAVLERMADGRIFLGAKAIEAGLADGFATEQEVLAAMQRGRTAGVAKRSAGSAGRKLEEQRMNADELKNLTIEQVESGNPAMAAAMMAKGHAVGLSEGTAKGHAAGLAEGIEKGRVDGYAAGHAEGLAKGLEEGKVSGAAAERQRIKDVEGQALPGHAPLIEQMKWDGTTTGAEAAVKIIQAENAARGAHRDKLSQDGLKPVTQSVVQPVTSTGGEGSSPRSEKDQEKATRIKAYQDEHKCDYKTAALAVSKAHPDLFRDR